MSAASSRGSVNRRYAQDLPSRRVCGARSSKYATGTSATKPLRIRASGSDSSSARGSQSYGGSSPWSAIAIIGLRSAPGATSNQLRPGGVGKLRVDEYAPDRDGHRLGDRGKQRARRAVSDEHHLATAARHRGRRRRGEPGIVRRTVDKRVP